MPATSVHVWILALCALSGCGVGRSITQAGDAAETAAAAAKSAAATFERLGNDVRLESDDWQKQLSDAGAKLGNEHAAAREFVKTLLHDVNTTIWSEANCAVAEARRGIADDLKTLAHYITDRIPSPRSPGPVVCHSVSISDDHNGIVDVRGYHFRSAQPLVEIVLREGQPYPLPPSAVIVQSDFALQINTSVKGVREQLPNGDQLNVRWPGSTRAAWPIAIVHKAEPCRRNLPGLATCARCTWKLENELEFRPDPTTGKGPAWRVWACPNMKAGASFTATITPAGPTSLGGNGAMSIFASGGLAPSPSTNPSDVLTVVGAVEDSGVVTVGLGLDSHFRSDAFMKTSVGLVIDVETK